MLIAVDEDIPFAAQAFARFGAVRPQRAREITALAVRDADAVIVRSVTRVNAALLEGSRVRFVGTATSGVDHIDLAYLRNRDIAFADASGANANAVAEYVVAALLHLSASTGLILQSATLGIVGFGHVGRRVHRFAAALGMHCIVHDPPLGRSTCEPMYRPLEEVLDCDVVTVHVPLERCGSDPTYHLVNDAFLGAMKPGLFLINTSRGAVADTAALKRALDSGRLGGLMLDVWENEPAIDTELARRCQLATAHIAGHSLDAKIAAVNMIEKACAKYLQRDVTAAALVKLSVPDESPTFSPSLHEAVRGAFDVSAADRQLRDTLGRSAEEGAAAFDALRAGWPSRREFHVRPVALEGGKNTDMTTLQALGFRAAAMATEASR